MRAACLALTAAFALASVAAAGPREIIAACVEEAPASAVGLAALEAACPGLTAALDDLGVAALLPEESRKQLTATTLEDAVTPGTAIAPPDAKLPGTSSLGPILKALVSKDLDKSWWERFKDWLRRHLIGESSSSVPDWLKTWLLKLTPPQRLFEVLFFALAVAVVFSAIAVIVRELRASGMFRTRARRVALGSRVPMAASDAVDSLEALEAAPAGLRAALLFQLIVRRLTASGRLRAGRSLTHRELRRQPPFADGADGARFARIASVAEEQLFAASPVAADRLDAALEDGVALYSSLEPIGADAR